MPSPRTAKRYFWVYRIPFLDGVIWKMTLRGVYTLVSRTCETVTVNHGKGSLQTCKPETPEDRELTTVAYPHGSPLMTRAIRSGEVSLDGGTRDAAEGKSETWELRGRLQARLLV